MRFSFLQVFATFAAKGLVALGDRPEIKQDTDEVVSSTIPTALLNVSSVSINLHDVVMWSQCSASKKHTPPKNMDNAVFWRDTHDKPTYYILQKLDDKPSSVESPDPKLCNSKLLQVIAGNVDLSNLESKLTLHQKYFVKDTDSQGRFQELASAMVTDTTRRPDNLFNTEGRLPYQFDSGVLMKGFGDSKSDSYFHSLHSMYSMKDSQTPPKAFAGELDAYDKWKSERDTYELGARAWLKLASTVDHTSSPMYPFGDTPEFPGTFAPGTKWTWVTCGSMEASNTRDARKKGGEVAEFEYKMRSGHGVDKNVQILHAGGADVNFPACRSQPLVNTYVFGKGPTSDTNLILHMEYEVSKSDESFETATKLLMQNLLTEGNVVFALVGLGNEGEQWNNKKFYHMVLVFNTYNTYVVHSENSAAFSTWSSTRDTQKQQDNAWLKQSTSVNLAGTPLYNVPMTR